MNFEEDIKNCVRVLEEGGTIVYPTDTIWGIGCDAMNEAAIEKIFIIKDRPKEKSFIILLADARDILQCVAAPPPDIIAIVEGFDKPTTVIYDQVLGFPDDLLHEDGSLAIRVTTDPFCKALIKRSGKPLVSTSANLSGWPSPKNFKEIDEAIKQKADYTVRYRQDEVAAAQPSRLVRINDEGAIEILRP